MILSRRCPLQMRLPQLNQLIHQPLPLVPRLLSQLRLLLRLPLWRPLLLRPLLLLPLLLLQLLLSQRFPQLQLFLQLLLLLPLLLPLPQWLPSHRLHGLSGVQMMTRKMIKRTAKRRKSNLLQLLFPVLLPPLPALWSKRDHFVRSNKSKRRKLRLLLHPRRKLPIPNPTVMPHRRKGASPENLELEEKGRAKGEASEVNVANEGKRAAAEDEAASLVRAASAGPAPREKASANRERKKAASGESDALLALSAEVSRKSPPPSLLRRPKRSSLSPWRTPTTRAGRK